MGGPWAIIESDGQPPGTVAAGGATGSPHRPYRPSDYPDFSVASSLYVGLSGCSDNLLHKSQYFKMIKYSK